MRSWDKTARAARWLLLFVVVFLVSSASVLGSASVQEFLNVKPDPAGGVIATAQVLFPASPAIVRELLTDFAHWPDLFEIRMRVVDLQIRHDVVTTDLRIEHALLPGERRLVTESRATGNQEIVTDLVGGDFTRYHRVWKLSPLKEGRETRAEFELAVAIDTIVPDWLVALATKRELEAHFRIVKEKAGARAVKEK
jgi:ribosome-associated toxin RatA of RatAB toxin-antitoxin module